MTMSLYRPSQPALVRWSGAAAIIGGVLAIIVTPFVTFAGFLAAPGGGGEPWMPWARLLRPLVLSFLDFGSRETVYATYGKVFLLVYGCFLLGLIGLQQWLDRDDLSTMRLARLGLQLARIGLMMNLLGNIGDYWLGRDILGQVAWGLSFGIGTMLGLLVYMIGSLLLGIALLRAKQPHPPRWLAVPLLLSPPAAIALTIPAVPGAIVHLPTAPTFALGIAWIVLGVALSARRYTRDVITYSEP